jgi:hypothetical protein
MLNWQTDPLLVDRKSVPWRQWVTANQMLAEKSSIWIPQLFLQSPQLNFYGIMVRKSDFVKSGPRDRLQSRFPYLCLTSRLQELIANNSDRLAVSLSQYYRKVESYGPRAWRKKLQRYLQQGRVPLPFFRVLAHLQPNEHKFLIKHFTDANLESFRHEPFHFPLEVKESLAYFVGVVAGDGTLTPHQVKITDCHEDYMRRLQALTTEITGTNPLLFFEGAANAWRLILKSKWYARFIHFLSGQPFGKKYDALQVPRIFRVLPNRRFLENRYCMGLFDTDGQCHRTTGNLSLRTKSSRLIRDLESLFDQRKISNRTYRDKNGYYSLSIARASIRTFAENVGFLCPVKQQALADRLTRGPAFFEFRGSKLPTLTTSGHFNFCLLPKLLVVDGYDFLQELASQEPSLKPAIPSKKRKKWARSGRVPFRAVRHALCQLGLNVYEEVAKRQLRYVYPYGKYPVSLPSRPETPHLVDTLAYLTPAPAQNTVIVTTGTFRTTAKRDPKEVVQRTATLFDVSKETFQCFDGRSFRIVNKLLCDYLGSFFQYEKPWQAHSPKEVEQAVAKWEDVL